MAVIKTKGQPSVVIAHIADQSIASGATTQIIFTSETEDTNSEFASNTFTATRPGHVSLTFKAGLGSGSGQLLGETFSVVVFKNGSAQEFTRAPAQCTVNGQVMSFWTRYAGLLAVGNTLDVRFTNNGAGSRTVASAYTELIIEQA